MTEFVQASARVRHPRLQSTNGFIRGSLFVALGLLGVGCSAVVDAGRVQCSVDADCTKRGAEFANATCVASVCQALNPWSCAEHAPIATTSKAPVSVELTVMDAIAQTPLVGTSASLCKKLDFECTSPVARAMSDVAGTVHFDITPMFDGFVELKTEGYDSAMMFLPPTVESVHLGVLPLTTVESIGLLGASLGKTLMPGMGRVLTTAIGCDKQPAGGVTVSVEGDMGDEVVQFYAVGGVPTFAANATDESGFGGFFNMKPGQVTLSGTLEDGTPVGRAGFFTRPDFVSFRRIQPWTD